MTLHVHEAHAEDETAVLGLITAALATYGRWSPGWTLPLSAEQRERTRWRTIDPAVRWLVASLDERPAGVCRWVSTERAALSLLMVDPSCWEVGVGSALHDATLRAMAEEGWRTARLTVPEGNTRARLFYEHRGWQATGKSLRAHAWLGFPMVQYSRLISAQRGTGQDHGPSATISEGQILGSTAIGRRTPQP